MIIFTGTCPPSTTSCRPSRRGGRPAGATPRTGNYLFIYLSICIYLSIYVSFSNVLDLFWPFNMGDFSFWYFWDIWLKKKLKNLILKKSKISGLAQIGSISAVWVFGVANFGFHYLRHFSINFENSCAHLVANFLNFLKLPQHFEFALFWMILWTKIKKWKSENI